MSLAGHEKGEAQVFCDRLFQAFGHKGYKEAGATLESRLKRRGKNPGFIDLLWSPRVLIEMKSRGENLQDHYAQAFEYWIQAVPKRPRFVVLCNFDEFWIYDFDEQLYEPKDRVRLEDLPKRYTALNFLLPEEKEPQFGNNRVAVTRDAADRVATVFNSLVARGESRAQAQRFILQCVVAMFSEDIDLLPRGLFSELLDRCTDGESTYDVLGSFFRQMNSPIPAKAGRFRSVPYFNGGLFSVTHAARHRPQRVPSAARKACPRMRLGRDRPRVGRSLWTGPRSVTASRGGHEIHGRDIGPWPYAVARVARATRSRPTPLRRRRLESIWRDVRQHKTCVLGNQSRVEIGDRLANRETTH